MSYSNESSFKKHSDKTAVANAFNAAANTYDQASVLQQEIGHRLIERLEAEALSKMHSQDKPDMEFLLDLGSGTGFLSRILRKKLPNTQIINVDLAFQMLNFAKKNEDQASHPTFKSSFLCADAENLALQQDIFSIVFSNCTLQWCKDYIRVFSEVYRLLKTGGCFLFSTFGPDTLLELRHCFKTLDAHSHVNDFIDMHPLGDALISRGFSYPVVERETITLFYSSAMELFKDLKLMGANYVYRKTPLGLMTNSQLTKIIKAYENFRNEEGLLPASFEVIYGYAKK